MSQELEGTLTNSADLVGTFGSEGGGGTTNYNDLINKPSINSVTLQGNKTAAQLGFATVATSGSYDDLSNKPTIPAAQVNSDWNASSGVAEILNKPTIAANAAELPISGSDSTDTKTYIDGHIKEWTSLGYFQLDNNATGDWTLTNSVENATDLLFFVSIDITGQPYNMPRNSMLVPASVLDNSGAIFYDFYIGNRQYFKITKVNNTKFNVSLTSVTNTAMRVYAYCR